MEDLFLGLARPCSFRFPIPRCVQVPLQTEVWERVQARLRPVSMYGALHTHTMEVPSESGPVEARSNSRWLDIGLLWMCTRRDEPTICSLASKREPQVTSTPIRRLNDPPPALGTGLSKLGRRPVHGAPGDLLDVPVVALNPKFGADASELSVQPFY
jgi:hypothetical protein